MFAIGDFTFRLFPSFLTLVDPSCKLAKDGNLLKVR